MSGFFGRRVAPVAAVVVLGAVMVCFVPPVVGVAIVALAVAISVD